MLYYDEFITKERKRFGKIRVKIENTFSKRTVREREINPEKEHLLTMLDKKRWEKYLAKGIIIYKNPHHLVFNINIS